jgi:predicted short-subunit dehydrogenase-like oxidoreductase (DUF2520 family)
MRIVLVGSGNVATHLGKALYQAGVNIVGVYSKTYSHACELASFLKAYPTDRIEELPDAEIFLFAVSDNALSNVIQQVAQRFSHRTFIHTAGSISLNVFAGCALNAAVMYPMQTFTKSLTVDFKGLPIYIEATNEATYSLVEQLALSLDADVKKLTSDERQWLHLAAVFACNFANHCYTLAAEVMQHVNLPFSDLIPLIETTTKKLYTTHPILGQTGPALRHDTVVMDKQIKLLADDELKQKIYSLMSRSIYEKGLNSFKKQNLEVSNQ